MAKQSNSFFSWLGRQLGRQVGHVKGAIEKDVTPKEKVVYRKTTVHEAELPERPEEKMRRTVIDEVVIPPPPKKDS